MSVLRVFVEGIFIAGWVGCVVVVGLVASLFLPSDPMGWVRFRGWLRGRGEHREHVWREREMRRDHS